jgi:hypothetical protein
MNLYYTCGERCWHQSSDGKTRRMVEVLACRYVFDVGLVRSGARTGRYTGLLYQVEFGAGVRYWVPAYALRKPQVPCRADFLPWLAAQMRQAGTERRK